MAIIRVTRELLEYALDLPEGVGLRWEEHDDNVLEVDGVECFLFETTGESPDLSAWGTYALQYEETEHGLQLVSAIPVT